ncbi:hypothetical protein [Pseudomonas sp. Marseille-Q5115]|uniref:hypothetical protein n=1 Tax=Pseudomonas sp. Marseille-Q5115 TaxID=2866593 RepID=UPI001CE4745F|nr:hypothetical protein [Pseudomonas sp. Marseille-Q5115]
MDHFYPAHNTNGFNERNLTYQFAKAFENRKNSCAFMEVPFFNKKREVFSHHIDALVFDKRIALFIESKRLFSPDKVSEIKADFERMNEANLLPVLEKLCLRQNPNRIPYRLILAETWKEKVTDWWMGGDTTVTWDRSWIPKDRGVITVKEWEHSSAKLHWLYAFSPLAN